MHVYKLSVSLAKLKFDKIMSILQDSVLIVCMCQVMDTLAKLLSTSEARVTLGYHLVRLLWFSQG